MLSFLENFLSKVRRNCKKHLKGPKVVVKLVSLLRTKGISRMISAFKIVNLMPLSFMLFINISVVDAILPFMVRLREHTCWILQYMSEAIFSDYWMILSVIPVFKNDREMSMEKYYHLVYLLSVVSKIFEKLKNNRLVNHLKKCNLFSDFQYDFTDLLDQLQIRVFN